MSDARKVRCSFYVRTEVTGGFLYDLVPIRSGAGETFLPTEHPPDIGDLVSLPVGECKVLSRSWLYPAYGSVAWPYGQPEPKTGPLLTLIVEDAEGQFIDQICPDDEL